jgi:hypothetical protein
MAMVKAQEILPANGAKRALFYSDYIKATCQELLYVTEKESKPQ